MGVKVKLKPTSTIITGLGLQKNGPAHAFFTEKCYKAMDKYVPKREGTLRETVDLSASKIIYEMPYAEYQYYGRRKDGTHVVKNYTNPGTGPYWDKRMWSAEKDNVVAQVQKFVDKRGG